jgi:hypothetical protein
MPRFLSPALLLGGLLIAGTATAGAMDAVSSGPASLVSNGDFSIATKDPAWPDNWRRNEGISWQAENGVHFLRLASAPPENNVTLFRSVALPSGVKALEVTFRYRAKNLGGGEKKGEAAGLFFNLFDAVKIEVQPTPNPVLIARDAPWSIATARFTVPPGASALEFRFGLFAGETGTLDLQKIEMKPISESEVPPAVASKTFAANPDDIPLHREGNRTIVGAGKPSVWFIHPYVDVLGHNFSDGILALVREARAAGDPLTVGVAPALDPVVLQDEQDMIYVFSYKNIDYALPQRARRLVFVNTWLRQSVPWPAARAGRKDVVLIGSRTLGNDGDGLAADKARWTQIQKDDPALTLTVLESTGYYLPISVWKNPLLKVILAEQAEHAANRALDAAALSPSPLIFL